MTNDKQTGEMLTIGAKLLEVLPALGSQLPAALSAPALQTLLNTTQATLAAEQAAATNLAATTAAVKQASAQLRDVEKRIRSAVKGLFGDNAPEYQAVGGKLLSKRKKNVRKAQTAVAPANTKSTIQTVPAVSPTKPA